MDNRKSRKGEKGEKEMSETEKPKKMQQVTNEYWLAALNLVPELRSEPFVAVPLLHRFSTPLNHNNILLTKKAGPYLVYICIKCGAVSVRDLYAGSLTKLPDINSIYRVGYGNPNITGDRSNHSAEELFAR